MRISLKFNWKSKIFEKAKIYFLNIKNKVFVDETFDKLHEIEKLNWTKSLTFFNYSIFCVWKMINDERKERVVMNIYDFNEITQSNIYFLFLQTKIISALRKCSYIIVVNCFAFFYQEKIHFHDQYKFIVVNHRD